MVVSFYVDSGLLTDDLLKGLSRTWMIHANAASTHKVGLSAVGKYCNPQYFKNRKNQPIRNKRMHGWTDILKEWFHNVFTIISV